MDSDETAFPVMEEQERNLQQITTIDEEREEDIAEEASGAAIEETTNGQDIKATFSKELQISDRRHSKETDKAEYSEINKDLKQEQESEEEGGATAAASTTINTIEDPWWWEIENEDLILDQAPNLAKILTESEKRLSANLHEKSSSHIDNVDLTLSDGNVSSSRIIESATTTEIINKTMSSNADESETLCNDKIANNIDEVDCTSKPLLKIVDDSDVDRSARREQSLEEFKEELRIKRMQRQTAVQDLRVELSTLRQQLAAEQALNRRLLFESTSKSGTATPAEMAMDVKDLVDADDEDPMSRGRHANIELANAQLALQYANSENISLRAELGAVRKQVGTLKEVIVCCKQMLAVKEDQCTQLKEKLTEIENSMSENEMKLMSDNLRKEYEKQLGNIRQLRELYEERQRVAAAEYENLQRLISIKKDELQGAQEKIAHVEERNTGLVKEVESLNKELATLREECNEHKFEKKALKEEMGAVNMLFSQMIVGFNGKNNLDIDRLTTMLEENRTLLNDMATKEINCSDGATLPKLLFELVEQAAISNKTSRSSTPDVASGSDGENVDNDEETTEAELKVPNENCGGEEVNENQANDLGAVALPIEINNAATVATTTTTSIKSTKKTHRKNLKLQRGTGMSSLNCPETEFVGKVPSTQEIIGNLPKVWKVLMELLSHHKSEQVKFEEGGNGESDCYKSVETPNGTKTELSVSKTYIKLKDLILEKKSLVKETNRLKTLNSHLDYRLNEQEKRLSAVSLELTKTWHLVGKMQRQHRQLHTQEQILRYQLQQKRRLLSELKEELEYCRRKWQAARAKNDESQEQWNDLRREFAQRKLDDAHNSAESGYSDSGPASDEDERNVMPEVSTTSACNRRKLLKEMFEHTRKIRRMQSTSPGRALANENAEGGAEVVLRWNSAPPTCGWREDDEEELVEETARLLLAPCAKGAIPKMATHSSRSRERAGRNPDESPARNSEDGVVEPGGSDKIGVERIMKLEEQCKSLIQQVLETSDNRERLEVQLCKFQDEIAPAQYPVPLDEYINQKRLERMIRASSAPASGTLTPREEEYTRKRSERLERLEEESRQLMSRIKRTSDRGHYLRCSLDRIRRAPSREGSFESNTEEEVCKPEEPEQSMESAEVVSEVTKVSPKSGLTETEEAYTARRSARLARLEEQGRKLVSSLARTAQRGETFEQKLDALHEHFGSNESSQTATFEQRIENIEKISDTRAERLRILEEEGKELLTRLSNTSERGTRMINRIAEREQTRLAARNSTAALTKATKDNVGNETTVVDSELTAGAEAAPIMPTPQNVASSSIVSDEINDLVTVTTTSSQLATKHGAIPKTPRSSLQLSPARAAAAKKARTKSEGANANANVESLEDMVRRLQGMPFPSQSAEPTNTESEDTTEETETKDREN